MYIQKIIKAGNSDAVVIPKDIVRKFGIQTGQKVTVDTAANNAIVIKKVEQKRTGKIKKASVAEFEAWLKNVLEEDAEILDELAVR